MSPVIPVSAGKKPYCSPTRTAAVEVSLDEFETEELINELKTRGEDDAALKSGICHLPSALFERITTLLLCGQTDSALQALVHAVDPMVEYRFSSAIKAGMFDKAAA